MYPDGIANLREAKIYNLHNSHCSFSFICIFLLTKMFFFIFEKFTLLLYALRLLGKQMTAIMETQKYNKKNKIRKIKSNW